MSNNGLDEALWRGYPRVTEEQAQQWLGSPYPAWQLAPEGVITAANLMALWLWHAIGVESRTVQPQLVLSVSVFDLVARNLDYIPVSENEAFFKKAVWDAKRIGQQLGRAGRVSPAESPLPHSSWRCTTRRNCETFTKRPFSTKRIGLAGANGNTLCAS